MTIEKQPPRFIAGKLVMLSRKNTRSGRIDYFRPVDASSLDVIYIKNHKDIRMGESKESYAGELDRGITILLLEDPIKVDSGPKRRRWSTSIEMFKQTLWKVRFLLDEKIYHMYLTKRQYGQELVRAVPRRLKKDYHAEVSG